MHEILFPEFFYFKYILFYSCLINSTRFEFILFVQHFCFQHPFAVTLGFVSTKHKDIHEYHDPLLCEWTGFAAGMNSFFLYDEFLNTTQGSTFDRNISATSMDREHRLCKCWIDY